MMDAEEFEWWRRSLGISQRAAAAALSVPLGDIEGYEDWSVLIPDGVEEQCRWLLAEAAQVTGPLREQSDALRQEIIELFPGFADRFDDAMAFGIGRMFTAHGLMSEFSTYYLRHIENLGTRELAVFFDRIETIFAADPHDRDGAANAIATCFLENISSTQAGEAGMKLMGPACLRFFAGWHTKPTR